jgi:hypothetical protein
MNCDPLRLYHRFLAIFGVGMIAEISPFDDKAVAGSIFPRRLFENQNFCTLFCGGKCGADAAFPVPTTMTFHTVFAALILDRRCHFRLSE